MEDTKDSPVLDIEVSFICPDTGEKVMIPFLFPTEGGERVILTTSCPACGGTHEYI